MSYNSLCKNCVKFVLTKAHCKPGSFNGIGFCRKHSPPTENGYPMVYTDAWCNDYELHSHEKVNSVIRFSNGSVINFRSGGREEAEFEASDYDILRYIPLIFGWEDSHKARTMNLWG